MDETYIEKESFKKYYLIYIAATFGGMVLILFINFFLFETSSSLSSVITLLAAMTTATYYAQGVKRKMTKAEKRKMILGTFSIDYIISILFTASIFGALYYASPDSEFLNMSAQLSVTTWVLIILGVTIYYYFLHWLGCTVGNKYKEPKSKNEPL